MYALCLSRSLFIVDEQESSEPSRDYPFSLFLSSHTVIPVPVIQRDLSNTAALSLAHWLMTFKRPVIDLKCLSVESAKMKPDRDFFAHDKAGITEAYVLSTVAAYDFFWSPWSSQWLASR